MLIPVYFELHEVCFYFLSLLLSDPFNMFPRNTLYPQSPQVPMPRDPSIQTFQNWSSGYRLWGREEKGTRKAQLAPLDCTTGNQCGLPGPSWVLKCEKGVGWHLAFGGGWIAQWRVKLCSRVCVKIMMSESGDHAPQEHALYKWLLTQTASVLVSLPSAGGQGHISPLLARSTPMCQV